MQRFHYFVVPQDGAAAAASWKVARDAETLASFGSEAEAQAFAIGHAQADIAGGNRAQVHQRDSAGIVTIWTQAHDPPVYPSR